MASHPSPTPALIDALHSAVGSPDQVMQRAPDRLAFAHDASHYLLTPQAVVAPNGPDEVARLLRASAEQGVPLTFRAGGTSLSGQAVTDAVLVDTRRNFRDIEVLDDGARVRVQPGVTVRQVNSRLARFGRKLGPDPASEVACTIGGVIANNSSGMSCGTRYNTYQTLESLVIVLPSGTVIDTAAVDADQRLRELEPELHDGLDRLRKRVWANPASVRTIEQQFSMKNTMGYGLNSFLDHTRPVDILAHLVVGSEGTLAFVAEATFRTIEVLPQVATGLLYFNDLSAATGSLPALVSTNPATIELLDAASLRVAQQDPNADEVLKRIQVDQHAALLLEYQALTTDELTDIRAASNRVIETLPITGPPRLTGDASARDKLWTVRRGLYATVAGARTSGTTALLEDIVVPVPELLDTCRHLIDLFDEHGYNDSVIFGHAKDGNIHFMLNERLDVSENFDRYHRFSEDMVSLVLSHSGSLKAEHGTGRQMAPYVRRQYGDELYQVMREIKRLCDPKGLLNPGVILTDEAPGSISNLKITPTVEKEVDRCVECGYCEAVCPSRDLTTTPRQRIVLRRAMAHAEQAGDLALLQELRDAYTYEAVETCAVDGLCKTVCPLSIDTADLVRRLRSENHPALERGVWLTAAKHWGATTRVAAVALTAAKILPAPVVTGTTKVMRHFLGTDTMPLWTRDLPGGGRARPRPTVGVRTSPEAVFFSACIGTMFGPAGKGKGVTWAFMELCQRAGVQLALPPGLRGMCCGTPWKSKGLTSGLAAMRERVLPALWEASRHGELPVVCDAASCTEGLRHMIDSALADETSPYRDLRVIDAVDFVADRVLPQLTVRRRLPSLALHPTCSSTKMGCNAALSTLARAICDDPVVPRGWGCCAFAGDRGLLHPELTASATRREAASASGTEYAAYASCNRTCELGMTRATGHEYRHLIELVEEATR